MQWDTDIWKAQFMILVLKGLPDTFVHKKNLTIWERTTENVIIAVLSSLDCWSKLICALWNVRYLSKRHVVVRLCYMHVAENCTLFFLTKCEGFAHLIPDSCRKPSQRKTDASICQENGSTRWSHSDTRTGFMALTSYWHQWIKGNHQLLVRPKHQQFTHATLSETLT